LTKERRLRVLENRVSRRIFGPKKDELIGEYRRLHIEEHYDLFASPNIIRVIKSRRIIRTEHVASMGDRRDSYRVLVGRPGGRRPLGKPWHRWNDNIKMDL
jgi:hypothetical protein